MKFNIVKPSLTLSGFYPIICKGGGMEGCPAYHGPQSPIALWAIFISEF